MRKTAASAAVSTECGFPNGAGRTEERDVPAYEENSGVSRSKHEVRFSEWRELSGRAQSASL